MKSTIVYPFMFATGIENSYPTIALPDGKVFRVDEMQKCQHYTRWKEDFALVKNLGINFLRYGPPYYSVHTAPGQYDWSFADETLHALREQGTFVIADLCHFGVPDWIESFQNPEWPRLFAEYARAFARRYPWIKHFTPVNEIYVAATFSAQYGLWNERLSSDRAFVTALKHLCQANIMAMCEILKECPDAMFIQSESSEYFHASDPTCLPVANFQNKKRFLALDFTYGYSIDFEMYEYLLDNGMTRAEHRWFAENQVKARCIMGTDYYATNEHMVKPDGSWSSSGEIFGYYLITRQYYSRYHLPIMHTETNTQDAVLAPDWLLKEWSNMHRLKQDGLPIVGFTWYSLTDQVDWDTGLRENNGRVNPCGLYDLDRKIRPVGTAYKKLIEEWNKVLSAENMGLRVF